MIAMMASEIAEVVGGTLYGDDIKVTGTTVLSSKDASSGSIFLAIKGEHVDGHSFVADAFSRGAVLAITSQQVSERCVVVNDVTFAVGKLAAHVRRSLSEITVIGITGSQGKTTTKELLASILRSRGETIAPEGNHNNELGVPLTLLQCNNTTKFCIVEMGARHKGDITSLAQIAQPHIGVVLRVAAAHIGEFGDLATIAETKGELIDSLSDTGIAILGNYDAYTPKMKSRHSGRKIIFGESATDDIRAADIELRDGRPHFDLVTPEGRSPVSLHLVGLHQISNALAAAAVSYELGFTTDEIAGALSLAQSHAPWRMELHELPDLLLINDAYNASPDSMAAALRTLGHLSQERGGESWAFLGKMAELGESAAQEHQEIGTLALELGIDHLIAIAAPEYAGAIDTGAAMTTHLYPDIESALEMTRFINRGDLVLCKGSRSAGLEVLAEKLESYWLEKILIEEEGKK